MLVVDESEHDSQASGAQRLDSAIQQINQYSLDKWDQNLLLYIGVTSSILIGYKHAADSCSLCFSYVIPTDNRFYICKSDVIPTDNSLMHAEVTSPTTLTSSLTSFVLAESKSRFTTLSEEDLNLLLASLMIKMQKAPKGPQSQHQYLKEKTQINLKRKIRLRTC